ncbi:protein of unknown function [Hyphomicrobium sp. 1Nfss2.1]
MPTVNTSSLAEAALAAAQTMAMAAIVHTIFNRMAGTRLPSPLCSLASPAESPRVADLTPKLLEPFRFSLKRGQALDLCVAVLLIGKPVPTFPEAL